jgi:hypothetical protein
MIAWPRLSSREKMISAVVAAVMVALLVDLAIRSWNAVLADMDREEKRLRVQWEYSSRLLARSRTIDEGYSRLRSRFPGLFEEGQDPTRLMTELDGLAKEAGVQMNMIRPLQGDEAGLARIELALCGSWPQVMQFFRSAESPGHLFQFPIMSVHRQERSGMLDVSATAQK